MNVVGDGALREKLLRFLENGIELMQENQHIATSHYVRMYVRDIGV